MLKDCVDPQYVLDRGSLSKAYRLLRVQQLHPHPGYHEPSHYPLVSMSLLQKENAQGGGKFENGQDSSGMSNNNESSNIEG